MKGSLDCLVALSGSLAGAPVMTSGLVKVRGKLVSLTVFEQQE